MRCRMARLQCTADIEWASAADCNQSLAEFTSMFMAVHAASPWCPLGLTIFSLTSDFSHFQLIVHKSSGCAAMAGVARPRPDIRGVRSSPTPRRPPLFHNPVRVHFKFRVHRYLSFHWPGVTVSVPMHRARFPSCPDRPARPLDDPTDKLWRPGSPPLNCSPPTPKSSRLGPCQVGSRSEVPLS